MSTPTATPRTQALWMKHHAFSTEEEATEALCDFRDHGNLLETELAAAKAECESLQALGSWAHTCIHHTDEQRSRAERCSVCATAELAAAKECVAIANRSADDQMHQKREAQTELARIRAEVERLCNQRDNLLKPLRARAEDRADAADEKVERLTSENEKLTIERDALANGSAIEIARLRADLERFTGHGLLDCHAICDQRDAAVARAERAEAESVQLSVQLRDQLTAARQWETVAIASWDEERGRALREAARVVELKARAEKAEAEVERLKKQIKGRP